MRRSWIPIAFATLNLLFCAVVTAAESDGYILLAISKPSGMASYELIFENVDEDQIVRIMDPATSSRFTFRGSPYLLKQVPPGRYFLSAINLVHDSDSQRVAELSNNSEYFEVSSEGISYIGSLTIDIQTLQGTANTLEIEYDPNSDVLRAAVADETELFRTHQVYVVVPGSDPIPIERRLLGL